MSIAALLAPIAASSGGNVTLAAEGWMQGRTLYGGAGALVAYTAATRAFPDLPPLRSAQIGFVGPVGAEIATRVEMVRQGRNVAIVRSELLVEGSVGLTALLDTIQRVQQVLNPRLEIEGLLRTMYDPRNSLTNEVSAQLSAHFGERVYRTVIPRNVRLAEAPSFGMPILAYDKQSKGAMAYLALAGEMLRRGDTGAAAASAAAG